MLIIFKTFLLLRDDKVLGTFFFDKPSLLVNDLELAKRVLIKDFDHFVDRRSVWICSVVCQEICENSDL